MAPYKSTELKHFASNLHSGNLIKLIESNQVQTQEKYNIISNKLKQSEEEITKQQLISQQNSMIIEKFQNQLQELTNQNSHLLEENEGLRAENMELINELQISDAQFAELDQLYDSQASDLSEKTIQLEEQLTALRSSYKSVRIDKLEQVKNEYNENLTKTRQLNDELQKELNTLSEKHNARENLLVSKIETINELNVTFNNKVNHYENVIEDLKKALSDANKQLDDMKNEIEKVKKERNTERAEKNRIIAQSDSLKLMLEDLKKKKQEGDELYSRLQQLTKGEPSKSEYQSSLVSTKYSTRKRGSSDDPKPIAGNSSDSDESSISFYQMRKTRKISSDHEGVNQLFNSLRNPTNAENKRRPGQKNLVPLIESRRRPISLYQQDIEIPESPIVSSSALTNPDLKF